MKKVIPIVILIFWFIGPLFALFAQTFTKITDNSNPIVTTPIDANYSGAAWIDYDNDGDLDLFTTRNFLFRNDGGGNFNSISTNLGEKLGGQGNGTTWADYDNDGDIDCFVSGNPSSFYNNNGDGTFSEITEGTIGDSFDNRGWACAWGDYNNDGFVDLVITFPAGFVGGGAKPSNLLLNNGDGRFSKIVEDYYFTNETAPYTVATWNDYDLDGDIDLFIGCGPAGTPGFDFNSKNLLIETGVATFELITDPPLGMTQQDGQVYNFIDFDNDQDLDVYLTNYGGAANRFYINNNGVYENLNNELILSGGYLSNTWGDIDNDGDVDVVLTSEADSKFFLNNQDGSFTESSEPFTGVSSSRAAVLGDYDDDGDLDLFLSGSQEVKGLYRNDIENGNGWIKFKLTGTVSNYSAIGAKVRVKATINGNAKWMIREISGQNSFDSQNSLIVHFGLGDASIVDSVIINWPSGEVTQMNNININDQYEITEEIPQGYLKANFTVDKVVEYGSAQLNFNDLSISDPADPITSWEWDLDGDGITDANTPSPSFNYTEIDSYTVSLIVSNSSNTDTLTRTRYISIKTVPGIPVISSFLPTVQDTTILKRGTVNFSIIADDTSGYPINYSWFQNGVLKSSANEYTYQSSVFFPAPRIDTFKVEVTNSFNTVTRFWYVHVLDSAATSVEKEDETIPNEYKLSQNYPNPFNPSTNIKFSLPKNTNVKITVYNSIGKEIKTLLNTGMSAGNYHINFNAFDLTSGVYFYRIQAEGFMQAKKMLLIR